MNKSLLIVGAAPRVEGNRRLPKADLLWCTLSAHTDALERSDQVWDCHSNPTSHEKMGTYTWSEWQTRRDQYSSKLIDIRSRNRKPLLDTFGPRFPSQIHWMLGASILTESIKHVMFCRLYNDNLSRDYLHQVPDLMYLIGYGVSTGMTFSADPTSVLFIPHTYGVETHE